MPKQVPVPGAKELFRYARIYPPPIVDLPSRLSAYPTVKPLLADSTSNKSTLKRKRQTWAGKFLKSKDYVADVDNLGLPLFDFLKIKTLPADRLPSRGAIADAKQFDAFLRDNVRRLATARRRVALSMFASTVLRRKDRAASLSRTLQFLELLPVLAKTERQLPYAPVVLKRYQAPAPVAPATTTAKKAAETVKTPATKPLTGREILEVWDVSNQFGNWKKSVLEAKIEEVRRDAFKFQRPKPGAKSKKKLSDKQLSAARRTQYRTYIKTKTATVKALTAELNAVSDQSVHERVTAIKSDADFQAYVKTKHAKDPAPLFTQLALSAMHVDGFLDLYEEEKERETGKTDGPRPCIYKSGDHCVEEIARDKQDLTRQDDVRPLGLAKLITVEEHWLGYLPGEISSVECVVKGEVREREMKSTKFFEEITERMTQEVKEDEAETQSKTNQDLNAQIETELVTRFSSDLNASLSGSGGGTIGVVDLQGGASLGAGVTFGLDSRLSTSSESNFSQEIVSKAVERTKKVTSELRRSRSYQLYETRNLHKIDNSGTGSNNNNAIYCFLDKRICITERVYGIRKFLNAELVRPGAGLITKETQKHILNLNDVGLPPTFDLSPNDITPQNYLDLVGKLRASNVSPPPPCVKVLSRTYKTDITNENREQGEISFKKVADVLTPFFGQYKRFLIQDKIEIPEGYRVQVVQVTVTHGSNGVSIPAHLPFSIAGAAIFALPTLAVATVPPYTFFYLPIAIWQILYAAAPFLHYNADSSNVTINIGHETEESPYFFFQPDFLIREIFDALGNASVVNQDFIDFLRQKLTALFTAFTSTSNGSVIDSLTDLTDEMKAEINKFITDLQGFLGTLITTIIPNLISDPGSASGPILRQIPSLSATKIAKIPAAILAPFKTFFNDVVAHLEELMQKSLADLFEYFNTMLDNTQTKVFTGAKGFTDVLPVSFNCIALKAGVTVNLSVYMVRIDDLALDAWKLETFDRLNQAYYQLVADYDNRQNMRGSKPVQHESPGLMRQEEQEVIKSRIINALHKKYSATPDAVISLEELQLFENAIDWENVNFRLFNYGPSGQQIAYEKLGFFTRADERRKQFMNALWSQALIPLQEDDRLEQVMIKFLESGVVDLESDLLTALADSGGDPLNELTEIYRDLVLQRQKLPEEKPTYRQEIIPTELIVIYEPESGKPYPVNAIGCGESPP